MKQTFCKLCDYTGGAEETHCPDCGAPLFVREAPRPEPSPTDEVNITLESKDRPSHLRLRWAAGFLAVCLAVQGVGLWLAHRPRPQNWSYVDGWFGSLVTPRGVWWLEDVSIVGANAGSGPQQVLYGWTRTADAFDDVDIDIYYYDGQALEKTDWTSAAISANGKFLFYVAGDADQSLKRRDLKTGREQELARAERLALGVVDDAGTACVYVAGSEDTFDTELAQMLVWQASTGTSRELEEKSALLALGRGGDNYAVYSPGQSDGLVVYGGGSFRVVWGKRGECTDIPSMRYLTDRDLTEVLYMDEDGLWHYENQDGDAATLDDLPEHSDLWYVRANGTYDRRLDRLTGRVYGGGNGRLYYLGEDLTLTDLTGEGAASVASFNEETQTLYYFFAGTGQRGGALYKMQDPCSDRRETTLVVEEGVRDYVFSQDGSALCVREGTSAYAATWKISVDGGPFQPLEFAKEKGSHTILPVNGGGCWYLGSNTSLRQELWYRAPDGTEELKLSYTSPASSTMYNDPPETVALPVSPIVQDIYLVSVGDGSQALALIDRGGWPEEGGTTKVAYWLLEADGTLGELEVLTP